MTGLLCFFVLPTIRRPCSISALLGIRGNVIQHELYLQVQVPTLSKLSVSVINPAVNVVCKEIRAVFPHPYKTYVLCVEVKCDEYSYMW